MKKIIAAALAALLLALTFTGCAGGRKAESAKLRVVTTIFPVYDFVREIAGDEVELTMLLSPGEEVHSYEPTPQDMIKIQNCDLFIYIGGESDRWVEGVLASLDRQPGAVVTLMDSVTLYQEETVEGMESAEEPDEPEGGYDEHIWTSPRNAVLMVKRILQALCAADPDAQTDFVTRADAYIEKLNALDADFTKTVAEGRRKTIVFADRFPFRYFVEAYGLEYFAAFPGCTSESEPSAATVAFLIDKVRQEEIPVVLYIEFSNRRMADTVCEQAGCRPAQLHSCHNVTRDEFESGASYLTLMQGNLETLREALS